LDTHADESYSLGNILFNAIYLMLQDINSQTDHISLFTTLFSHLSQYTSFQALDLAFYEQTLTTTNWVTLTQDRSHDVKKVETISPLTHYVLNTYEAVRLNDIAQLSQEQKTAYWGDDTSQLPDCQALLSLPLVRHHEIWGVLTIEYADVEHLSDETVTFVKLLADNVAGVLHSISLSHTQQLMSRLNEHLRTQEDDTEKVRLLLIEFCNHLRVSARADLVTLHLYDEIQDVFERPIIFSGYMHSRLSEKPTKSHLDAVGVVRVALNMSEPVIYSTDVTKTYEQLGGKSGARSSGRPADYLPFEKREHIEATVVALLEVQQQTMGVMFINFRNQQQFEELQRVRIENLITYAASFVANFRHFATMQNIYRKQLPPFREMISQLNYDDILQKTIDKIQEVIRPDEVIILRYDEPDELLRPFRAVGELADYRIEKTRISVNPQPDERTGLVYQAFNRRRTVWVNDVHNDPHFSQYYIDANQGTKSELDIPIIVGNRPIGVISLESSTLNFFKPFAVDFVESIAKITSDAIANALNRTNLRRLQTRIHNISRIHHLLSDSVDIEYPLEADSTSRYPHSIIEQLVRMAIEDTQSDYCNLYIYRDDMMEVIYDARIIDGQLDITPREMDEPRRLSVDGQGIVPWVRRNKKSYLTNDVASLDGKDGKPNYVRNPIYGDEIQIRGEIAVPLIQSGSRVVGVVNVESEKYFAYDNSDRKLLEELAQLTIVTIELWNQLLRLRVTRDVVNQVNEIIEATDKNRKKVCQIIIDSVLKSRPSCYVYVLLRDEKQRNYLKIIRSREAENDPERRLTSFDLDVFPYSQVYHSNDNTAYHIKELSVESQGTNIHLDDYNEHESLIVVPLALRSDDRSFLGTLNIAHLEPNYFTSQDIDLLEQLGNQLTQTLNRLQLVKDNQHKSIMATMGTNISSLFHDLKNNITLAEHYSQFFYEYLPSLPGVEPSDQIVVFATELNGLTEEISSLAIKWHERFKALVDPFKPVDISIDDIVKMLYSFKSGNLEHQIDLQIDVKDEVIGIRADEDEIRLALKNIIDNAYDAVVDVKRKRVQPQILIEIRNRQLRNQPYVMIQIQDNGVGMTEHQLNDLFELGRSFRDDDMSSSRRSGSGFGLWSAKHFIEKSGGIIDNIHSIPNEGTRFDILLPALTKEQISA